MVTSPPAGCPGSSGWNPWPLPRTGYWSTTAGSTSLTCSVSWTTPWRPRYRTSSLPPAAACWLPTRPPPRQFTHRNRRTPAAWPSSPGTLRPSLRATTSSAALLRPPWPTRPRGQRRWPPEPVAPEPAKWCRAGGEQPPVLVRFADRADQDVPETGGPAGYGALVEFIEVEQDASVEPVGRSAAQVPHRAAGDVVDF